MGDLITIKGGRDGLRVRLDGAAEWATVLEGLRGQLEQGGSFFAGAKLIIDIGDRQVDRGQLEELTGLLQQHGLAAESLDATARESRNAAREIGLTARPLPRYDASSAPAQPESEAIVITRTVRSGQVVRHTGHITLIGDVNPGAEIVAGGSVIVWGRLRGLVHAGALGNREALICALELRPTQLRIADQIARTPDDVGASTAPEMARLNGGQIVVEAWEPHRK